jgi:hypothetical protein
MTDLTHPLPSAVTVRRDRNSAATRRAAFRILRIVFGLIWGFNAIYQMNPAYIHGLFLKSIAAHAGQSAWYVAYTDWAIHTIKAIGAPGVALFTVAVAVLLALSLLSGVALRPMAWIGIVFTFVMWTLNGHLGGPYTMGATDPGTLIVYSLAFIAVLLAEPAPDQPDDAAARARRYRLLRLLFGALWAFDAGWKWTPFFIHHSLSYLVQAQAGQPAWIVAYIQFFIDAFRAIGQETFGVIAALAETVIAVGLLAGRGMRFVLPFGLVYSLGVWTVAEGWGGPYGAVTGVGGDVLGTTIIYALIFVYLMVMYPPSRPQAQALAG